MLWNELCGVVFESNLYTQLTAGYLLFGNILCKKHELFALRRR